MNKFIKEQIEEEFKSKKQEKYSDVKNNNKTLIKKKKNKKLSDEMDMEEIVDDKGNIARSEKPLNMNTKGVTSNSTSDEVANNAMGQMGTFRGQSNRSSSRFWGESDMSKTLGYEDTLGQDKGYADAEDHFEDELELSPEEAKERLEKMGYDENLPDDKVRLVENPKKFVEDYLESLLPKKTNDTGLVKKDQTEDESEVKINPIVLKQIKSLKNSLKNNGLSIDDVVKQLKNDE